jgi:hypothetical protein
MSRISLLSQGEKDRKAAYDAAWGLLLGHLPDVHDFEQCRAKCWLSYRTMDGEVPYADYTSLIKPVQPDTSKMDHANRERWEVSLMAADVFASLPYEPSAWQAKAFGVIQRCVDNGWKWPPTLLTAQRMYALLAYDAWVSGSDTASGLCEQGWEYWKASVAVLDWRRFPFHVQHDNWPLHILMWVSIKCGACKPEESSWMSVNPLTKAGIQKVQLLRCVSAINKTAKHPERIIFASLDGGFVHGRVRLADEVPNEGLFVELGVASAVFAEQVLSRNNGMNYIGIDAWADHHDESEMKYASSKLRIFGRRVKLRREFFSKAVTKFQDESCDVIYVDGYAHTGQDDGRTLREWWPKVKPGGVFAGHDYDEKWPLTVAAVDAFAKSLDLPIEVIKDEPFSSWLIRKPALDSSGTGVKVNV